MRKAGTSKTAFEPIRNKSPVISPKKKGTSTLNSTP